MRSHKSIVSQILKQLAEEGFEIPAEKRARLEQILTHSINLETAACIQILHNADSGKERDCLFGRVEEELLFATPEGERIEEDIETRHWAEWYPGLANGQRTLREVYEKLPGASDVEIPYLVRLFENPESPVAFRGAVTLKRHDLIHILLGRGLVDQDEAFVLGFTMGSAQNLSKVERWAFKRILESYPEPFRIFGDDLQAYDLGVEAAQACGAKPLFETELEEMMDQSVAVLQRQLSIDVDVLREYFRREQELIPRSLASVRLPVI